MKPVIWLDEALADLRSIGEYIARDNAEAAYRVMRRIKAAADTLTDHPEMGRPGRVDGTRELVVSDLPYILPYQITAEAIRILAVMYTSRKWPDTYWNLS
jgi:addiction module RelE/StbE family toxin